MAHVGATVMSAATPGPWTAHGRGIFAGDLHLAETTHPRDIEEHPDAHYPDYDQSIANARLIAEAPDLLAALKWFVDDLTAEHAVMVDFDANVARARAAIARAEGTAP